MGPMTYKLSRERDFLFRRFFGYVSRIDKNTRMENSKLSVEAAFSSVM